MAVIRTKHNVYEAHYHIVFPVKYRKALLRQDIPLAIAKIAEEIAEPFVIEATAQAPAVINYDAMLADLDRVNRIYNEHIEMDDEDVLALI